MLDAGGVRLAGGGARLRRRIAAEHVKYVDGSWFAADAMLAGGEVAFEDMTQPQLKDELAVRGEARSGLKHVLQRRLHALLVQAAIEARREDAEMGEAGEGDEEGGGKGRRIRKERRRKGSPNPNPNPNQGHQHRVYTSPGLCRADERQASACAACSQLLDSPGEKEGYHRT